VTTKTGYTPGTFCWVELATSDAAAAKEFYTGVFGWDAEDDEIPGGGIYTSFKINGKSVGASNQQQEEEAKMGVPPHWNSYISVEDADQAVKIAEGAGATVLAPPFDVMELGRMAVLTDPTGAVVSVWQPRTSIGAQVRDEDNTLSWSELITPDAGKAQTFYGEVFGWEHTDMDMPQGTYTTSKIGDEWAAGIMERGDIPPNWLPYFQVADADATAARATSAGAQALMQPEAVQGVGKIGVFADPQGATFGFIEPEPQQ
jgi:uncharacterized protein